MPLLTRKKWNVKSRNFQVGHLILVSERGVSYITWPLARILEVETSCDVTVKGAKMKTHDEVYVQRTASPLLLEEL